MPYLHGVFGEQVPSTGALSPAGVSTLPVYFGTAPINQVTDPAGAVNKIFLVNSFEEAKAAVGYSDDWATFTLCEAIYAHFKNSIQNIGPIVLINVMDPGSDVTSDSASVTLTNDVGYIDSEKVVLDSCAIATYVLGTDFTAEFVEVDGVKKVKITDLTVAGIPSPATVTYDELDVTKVLAADIIGSYDAATGVRKGISLVGLINQETGMIPGILAAPGWSQTATIYTELVAKCQNINGHWDAVCAVDIDSSASADTITEAITKKTTDGYTSKYSKIHWPKAKYGDKLFHLSTLAVVRMQQTDYANDNCPHESPSNKQIMSTGNVLASGTAINIDETQGNTLNAEGITTAVYSGGQWRLWGPHMGNYKYGATILPEDKFDSGVRSLEWLSNSFQVKYLSDVDSSLSRRKVETILDDAQIWLNALVTEGKFLYASIAFNETSNPTADLVEGDFVFDVGATTVPVGKSLTFKVQYTTAGISTLFGGEQ